jgi:hypothetical protein
MSTYLLEVFILIYKQMFLKLFEQITRIHSELDDGQTMVNPLQLASMLVDWMDPEKAVYVSLSGDCV